MKNQEIIENSLGNLHQWYQGLGQKDKDNSAIFAIVGNVEEEINHELFCFTNAENFTMILAQALLNDANLFDLVKASIGIVEDFLSTPPAAFEQNFEA